MRHRFNRFENKYLIAEDQLPQLRHALADHLEPDPHQPEGGARVESLYFDSADLRCYWEKIEGLKFRRKVRIRRYGDGYAQWDSPVTVEVKQRVNRVTQKRRLELKFGEALALCDVTGDSAGIRLGADALRDSVGAEHHSLLAEVEAMATSYQLRPIATTSYMREAYFGRDAETGIRVTFDHNVCGRDRDFLLGSSEADVPTVPVGMCVLEIKADERLPLWLTDLTARYGLDIVRMSKYCQTIEAFKQRPASAAGAVEPIFDADRRALTHTAPALTF